MYIPHVDQFLELKPRTKLEWFDFLHIERPNHAKRNLMKAYHCHFHQIRGLQECREARGVVPPVGEPPAGLLADVMGRLDSGEFFLINKKTIYPAVEKLEIKEDNTIEWELSVWLRDNIKLYLDHALYNCRVPHMNTPVRGEDLSLLKPAPKPAEKPKKQIERHIIQLEVEVENNRPLPEKKYATIVVHNTSQDSLPVKQRRDVIYDPESRIFKTNSGEFMLLANAW